MGGEAAVGALAPGFRFHPTDEELVSFYLKRKVCGKPFRFDAISEVDLYKSEPWDLPGLSRLKSRDLEWYFFGALDKKYGKSSRTNRATEQGYWKTTGKDRQVRRNNRIVGMKKTLVFHIGRAPHGERTNWVMHEYRLVDGELEKMGFAQDAYVLCRIFQKSGSGPKNGERYGAPLIEEEWDEDALDENLLFPKGETGDDAFCDVGDEEYLQPDDLEQNIDMIPPSENIPFPLNFYYGDGCNDLEQAGGFPMDNQNVFIGRAGQGDLPKPAEDQKFLDFPEQYQMDPAPIKDEYFELNDFLNPVDGDYIADNPVNDEMKSSNASDNFPVDDGTFLEIKDLQNPVEAVPSGLEMLDEYLTYFDAVDNDLVSGPLDSSKILESEYPILDQSAFNQTVNSGTEELAIPQPSNSLGSEVASSSKKKSDDTKLASDAQCEDGWDSTLVKGVSRMLGSIPAPPAFAEEFCTKEAALGQNSSMQSPGSIHVTAGVIRISDMTFRGSGKDWSLYKVEDLGLLISYGMTRGDVMATEQLMSHSVGFEPLANLLSGKAGSLMMRSMFYLFFFWVLILSVSYKIGCCFYTK
ncbi:NAC domain-containing protein 53-like [Macadamia integrifolia]|uniref:NAC domain-containing protein 53-like n=1 Tax=Macadamia integrifolia TaxID=60698 RepID=UPI001C4FD461|nr:NAC domain-containing protein 53-like [Macadamia integrifolia]